MTSKHGKQASDAGTDSSRPMAIDKFNKRLEKESPQMFKKMHGGDGTPYASEKEFLDELKKNAPDLHEELRKCHFKFQLDEHTKSEWVGLLDRTNKMMHALEKFEHEVEDINAPQKAKK